jgi:hypothetical protein
MDVISATLESVILLQFFFESFRSYDLTSGFL